MILFKCVLPFSVSVNQMYNGGSGQQRFKSAKYKAWLASCPKLTEMNISEPVTVEYIFTFPDKRARDLSNYIKCPEDYLVNSKVLKDDNYDIVTKILIRHEGVNKADPKVTVLIRRIGSETPAQLSQQT